MSSKKREKKLAGAHVQVLLVPDESIAFDFGSFGVIIERVPDAQGTKLVDVPRVFFDKDDEYRYLELFFDHWEEFFDQAIHRNISLEGEAFEKMEKIFSQWEYLSERRLVRVVKEHFPDLMKVYSQYHA